MTKMDVFMEVAGQQYDVKKVTAKVEKEVTKKAKGEVKNLNIYVKPEDGKAYYTYKEGKNTVSGDITL
ncbi:MAG: DUF6465 family protein [Lachnospiraceae bacterium]|nr:DUF6465 family protein [Lachnospiraceae bacterium]